MKDVIREELRNILNEKYNEVAEYIATHYGDKDNVRYQEQIDHIEILLEIFE